MVKKEEPHECESCDSSRRARPLDDRQFVFILARYIIVLWPLMEQDSVWMRKTIQPASISSLILGAQLSLTWQLVYSPTLSCSMLRFIRMHGWMLTSAVSAARRASRIISWAFRIVVSPVGGMVAGNLLCKTIHYF